MANSNVPGCLHVGFYNYVLVDHVIALIDYKASAAKKIVKSARAEKPRAVMDVTRGRKANTLIVLTGDRYLISAIYRQQLAKRLGAVSVPVEEELPVTSKGNPLLKGAKSKINVEVKDVGPTQEG